MIPTLRVAFFLVAFIAASVTAFTAQTTWFHTGVAPGACGQMHYDSEYVVALAFGTFDTYPGADPKDPNHNPVCNKTLKATYEGKSVVVMVVDRCADCYQAENIDLSPTAFSMIADQSKGRLFGVKWDWTDLPVGPATGEQPPAPEASPKPTPKEPTPDEQRRSKISRGMASSPPLRRAARLASAFSKREGMGETTKSTSGHKSSARAEHRIPQDPNTPMGVTALSHHTRGPRRMERRRGDRPIVVTR
ncbi:hypothetical protein FPV67DRAFT_1679871 [Lyophyllum atratum]|nr:hypothetical protein FPV67DRAFT_1679871 [Lyophyllum atratum]